tara:strand:+ start:86 stop:325 length:240 start_codon:yes stop_codon:yes gene_type:complete
MVRKKKIGPNSLSGTLFERLEQRPRSIDPGLNVGHVVILRGVYAGAGAEEQAERVRGHAAGEAFLYHGQPKKKSWIASL